MDWQSNDGYSRERNQKAIVSRSRAEHGLDRRVAPERPFAATALSSWPALCKTKSGSHNSKSRV